MEHLTSLELALQQLRLPVFGQLYARLAQEAQSTPLSYERYLLALAEQELAYRNRQRQQQYLKLARFPVLKELADFEFRRVPSLNQARVLTLAAGHYIRPTAPFLLVEDHEHHDGGPDRHADSSGYQSGVPLRCEEGVRVDPFATGAGSPEGLCRAGRAR